MQTLVLCCITLISLVQPAASFSRPAASYHHFSVSPLSNPVRASHWKHSQNNGGIITTAKTAAKTTTKTTLKASSDGEHSNIISKAFHTYTDYAQRLWDETSNEARKSVAKDKTKATLRRVEQIMNGEEYVELGGEVNEEKRLRLLDACRDMLEAIEVNGQNATAEETKVLETAAVAEEDAVSSTLSVSASIASSGTDDTETKSKELQISETAEPSSSEGEQKPVQKKKKARRSISFGAFLGLGAAAWVYSGNYIFTTIFMLMTALGQLEYYRMVMNTGVYPARKISIVGALSMYITALFAPDLHQVCLPAFACYAMIWFLTKRKTVSTIPEIATTFTGMFYLGYIPSFWIRIRMIGKGLEPTRLAPLMGPVLERFGKTASSLPSFIPKTVHLPVTTGATFIFWTWLCIAFSDVGAYFFGKSFGKTKLGQVAPAAGAASPNKTVEGALGGALVSAGLGLLGAWVQKWPYWYLTGPLHGVMLAVLGLIGDLTASILKRDAGLKDFGDLIPEHGGIMDRVDSYIFTAPYSWFVLSHVGPWLQRIAAARMVVV